MLKSIRLKLIALSVGLLFIVTNSCFAQGPRGTDIPKSSQPVGDAGIAWYTTWNSGVAEAKRSNRPIFFMSAAATCSGISGVF